MELKMKEIKLGNRYIVYENGTIWSIKQSKFLKGIVGRGGYYRFNLVEHGNCQYLHRLVAKLFIENPENKPMVNHKDGNKLNNNVSNLEWVDCKENTKHAIETGLRKQRVKGEWNPDFKGDKHHNRRLSELQVREARELYATGDYSYKELGEKYGVHLSTVAYAVSKKFWKSVE